MNLQDINRLVWLRDSLERLREIRARWHTVTPEQPPHGTLSVGDDKGLPVIKLASSQAVNRICELAKQDLDEQIDDVLRELGEFGVDATGWDAEPESLFTSRTQATGGLNVVDTSVEVMASRLAAKQRTSPEERRALADAIMKTVRRPG